MKEFPVDSIRLFKNSAKATILSFSIILPVGVGVQMIGSEKTRTFVLDWITDPMKTIKMIGVLALIIGSLLSFLFALSMLFKLWKVQLDGDKIYGRSFYGFKRNFLLEEVISADLVSNTGISGWIFKTKNSGSIYVLSTTTSVETLLKYIEQVWEKQPPKET